MKVISMNKNVHNIFNYNIASFLLSGSVAFSCYLNMSTKDTGLTSCMSERHNEGCECCAGCSLHPRCVDTFGFMAGRSFFSLSCICSILSSSSNRSPLSCGALSRSGRVCGTITAGNRAKRPRCFAGSSFHRSFCRPLGTSDTVPNIYGPMDVSNASCFSNKISSPVPIRGTLTSNYSRIFLVLAGPVSFIGGPRVFGDTCAGMLGGCPTIVGGLGVHRRACGGRVGGTLRLSGRNGIAVVTPSSKCSIATFAEGVQRLGRLCGRNCVGTKRVLGGGNCL